MAAVNPTMMRRWLRMKAMPVIGTSISSGSPKPMGRILAAKSAPPPTAAMSIALLGPVRSIVASSQSMTPTQTAMSATNQKPPPQIATAPIAARKIAVPSRGARS